MELSSRWFIYAVKARARLVCAVTLAVFSGILVPEGLVPHLATRLLIAWNVGALAYLALAAHLIMNSSQDSIHRRARAESENRVIALVLVLMAAAASLGAIFAQLSLVKELSGNAKTLHLVLAGATILTSWLFTHTMFALHYAHGFYAALIHGKDPGILFPKAPISNTLAVDQTADSAIPDYVDFLYCAFIIGTSGQTADVAFTSRPMRRIALVHSVFAFFFNATLLATTVNIAASFI